LLTANTQAFIINEGALTLPEGYQDRTVNVFTVPGSNAPALNISRDSLKDSETLSEYIVRQLALMAKHLKSWKQGERLAATLGDNLFHGEFIDASYLRDGKRVYQRQAVFALDNRLVMVFTQTSSAQLNESDQTLLTELLHSFHPQA
jgi:hypothetical protein